MEDTYIFVRIAGDEENEWLLITTAESLIQASAIEDRWIYNGYETKLVNKMTGRRIR